MNNCRVLTSEYKKKMLSESQRQFFISLLRSPEALSENFLLSQIIESTEGGEAGKIILTQIQRKCICICIMILQMSLYTRYD